MESLLSAYYSPWQVALRARTRADLLVNDPSLPGDLSSGGEEVSTGQQATGEVWTAEHPLILKLEGEMASLLINWQPTHTWTACQSCIPGKELCPKAERLLQQLDVVYVLFRRGGLTWGDYDWFWEEFREHRGGERRGLTSESAAY